MKLKNDKQVPLLLMALLMASVVLSPPVIADEQTVSGFDLDNYVLPELKINESIETIAISGELSPQQEPGKTVRGTYGIPYGSIVVHSADGMTQVFDRNGNQILSISDDASEKIPTPAGVEKPCTKVHQLPNDSSAYYRGEDKIFIIGPDGELILIIINESEEETEEISSISSGKKIDNTLNVSGEQTPTEPAPLSIVPALAALFISGFLWRR